MISFTEQQWQSSKEGLISKLREPDNNINGKSKRLWHSIGIKDTDFNESDKIAEELEKIERIDLIRFMVELKSRTSDRLIMATANPTHMLDTDIDEYEKRPVDKFEGTYITDVETFQQQSNIFEL
jgi:secreted Zn-dependent insulinase-like peptidase